MENLYSTWRGTPDGDKNYAAYRLLRRLRIALIFWLISFVVTVIWFTNSPAF